MKNVSHHFLVRYLLSTGLVLITLMFQPLAIAGKTTHHHQQQPTQPANPSMRLSVEKIIDKNDKKIVIFKLTDAKTHQPVRLSDLDEVHTQRIHVLIIDDSLTDYSHVHPKALEELGIYEFEWKPSQRNASYRVWADLLPVKTKTQEYLVADLTTKPHHQASRVNSHPFYESIVDGYKFQLSFDKKELKAGKPVTGKILVTNVRGKPIRTLEPVMGAFAHIVGFNDDLKTIVHIHPMGQEPSQATDRGGPELVFHLEPEKAGFVKIFAQVRIEGKELFVPFGIVVKKA
ncbi:secreted protein [Legionella lansingensis]|uniref:Secreted protein n=1 Tax=Legionella lansingensis TaxID=45067 RepID=A0A0W0VVF5_9GAMM|nr:hypothetical protein [Legionella lansingensis]KTD23885.1 hypothetical protein Llan_0666 [Legionella lansingensis]SNV46488.1 secreted protein [Legionella lansingensis]